MIKRKCLKCNTVFDIYPSRKQKFCSHKCACKDKAGFRKGNRVGIKTEFKKGHKNTYGFQKGHKINIGRWKGDKSCNWKGGTKPLRKKVQATDEYQEWRQAVFIRDDFTCQDCKKRGGHLQAHHKYPFYKIVEDVKFNLPLLEIFEALMIYTPLWDISNGKTLCDKCHKKIKPVNQFTIQEKQ